MITPELAKIIKKGNTSSSRERCIDLPSAAISFSAAEEVNNTIDGALLAGSIFDWVVSSVGRGDGTLDDSAPSVQASLNDTPVDLSQRIAKDMSERQSVLQRVASDLTLNSMVKGYDERPWWEDVRDKVSKVRQMDPQMALTITQTSDSDYQSLLTISPLTPYHWQSMSTKDKIRSIATQGDVWSQWAYQLGLITLSDIDKFLTASALATAVLSGKATSEMETALTELMVWISSILSSIQSVAHSSQESSFPGISSFSVPLEGDIIESLKSDFSKVMEKWDNISSDYSSTISNAFAQPSLSNVMNLVLSTAAIPIDSAAAVLGLDTQLRNAIQIANLEEDTAAQLQQVNEKLTQIEQYKSELDKQTSASSESTALVHNYPEKANAVAAQAKLSESTNNVEFKTEIDKILSNQVSYLQNLKDKIQQNSAVQLQSDWPAIVGLTYKIGNATLPDGDYPPSNVKKERESGLAESYLNYQENLRLIDKLAQLTGASNDIAVLYAWFIIRTTVVYESGSAFRLNPGNSLGMAQVTLPTIQTVIGKGLFPNEALLTDGSWSQAMQQVRLISAVVTEKLIYYYSKATLPALIVTAAQSSIYSDYVRPSLVARYGYYMGYSAQPKTVAASQLMKNQLEQIVKMFDSGDWFSFINA